MIDERREYDGDYEMIVMSVPKNTVGITLTAKVLDEETCEIYETECKLSFSEVKDCRKDYLLLDPTDDAFALYALSDEYRKLLEETDDEY